MFLFRIEASFVQKKYKRNVERETGFELAKITFPAYSTFFLIILPSPVSPCKLSFYSLQPFLFSSNQFYPFYKNWWGYGGGKLIPLNLQLVYAAFQVTLCNSQTHDSTSVKLIN